MSMSKKSSPRWKMEKFPKCLKFLHNSSDNTKRSYFQTITKYENFIGASIEEAIEEALEEQSNGTPFHKLSVIDKIEDFQDHLIEEGLVIGTIKNHITTLKTIYGRNRVKLPYIETINPKIVKRREYIEFKDILTKDEIKMALNYMTLPSQARTLVMVQGGLSNEECEHLTTRAFIDELYKYHQCDDDIDALKWLADVNHPVIWVTKLIRWKTKKPYYGIIGAEAVNKIAEAKLYEKTLAKNRGKIPPKLLSQNKDSFARACRRVNKKCGFGLVAEESKFRSHNLRRFHGTYIRGSHLSYEEQSILSLSEINELQGRGKTSTEDTYIKSNPLEQKLLYAKVMNQVMLFNEYEYTLTGDDVVINIKDYSSENKKLKDEVENLSNIIQKKKRVSEKVSALRDELGDDVFKEMIKFQLQAENERILGIRPNSHSYDVHYNKLKEIPTFE